MTFMVHWNSLSPDKNDLMCNRGFIKGRAVEIQTTCAKSSSAIGVFQSSFYYLFFLWAIHVSPLPFPSVPTCSITLFSCLWILWSSVAMAARALSTVTMSTGEVASCSFRPDVKSFIPKPSGVGVGWSLMLLSADADEMISSSLFSQASSWCLLCRSIRKVAFNLLSLSSSSSLRSTKLFCSLRLACSACTLQAASKLGAHCWHIPFVSFSSWVLRDAVPPQHCSTDSSSMFCLMLESSRAIKSLSQREKSVWHAAVGDSPAHNHIDASIIHSKRQFKHYIELIHAIYNPKKGDLLYCHNLTGLYQWNEYTERRQEGVKTELLLNIQQ